MTTIADSQRPKGRNPNTWMLRASRHLERLGWVLRRLRWCGRGWPWSVRIGRGLRVTGAGAVRLGPSVRLEERVWLHAEAGAEIEIGARTAVGRDSFVTSAGRIAIGSGVLFGPRVMVTDNSHGRPGTGRSYIDLPVERRGPIHIQDDVWLAAGVNVISSFNGISIGRGALVPAGMSVRTDVPPESVFRG